MYKYYLYKKNMRWPTLSLTLLVEIAIIRYIPFMHNTYAIIAFFCIVLLMALLIQESTEDMPVRKKRIISGIMLGTYLSAIIISVLAFKQLIPLS
jgi:hypothetical protein